MSEVKELIFDIIMLVIATAILDDAFESNTCSVKGIFFTCVSASHCLLQLKFHKKKLNIPICQQSVSTPYSIRTHEMKLLKYHTYLYYLQCLSLAVGMIKAMKPYDLRQGTSKAVNSKSLKLPCFCAATSDS